MPDVNRLKDVVKIEEAALSTRLVLKLQERCQNINKFDISLIKEIKTLSANLNVLYDSMINKGG